MSANRVLKLTNQGVLQFYEDESNGANKIALQAPAALAGDLTYTLPGTIVASAFLQTAADGTLSWSTSTATLQTAYDAGEDITLAAGKVMDWGQANNEGILALTKTGAGVGIPLSVHNDGTGIAVSIHQDGAGKALEVTQDGAATAATIDQNTNTYGLIVTKSAAGGGDAVYVDNDGTGAALTLDQGAAGNALYVIAGGDIGVLVDQAQDFAALKLDKSGAGAGHVLDVENAGTGHGVDVLASAVGSCLNLTQTGAGIAAQITVSASGLAALAITQGTNNPSIDIFKSAAGAGDAIAIHNDGTGYGVYIDQDGAGYGIYVSQAGASPCALFYTSTNYDCAQITKNGVGAGYAAKITNAGTGAGLFIDQNGIGYGLDIDQGAAESALRVTQSAADIAAEIVGGASCTRCISIVQGNSNGYDIYGTSGKWYVDPTGAVYVGGLSSPTFQSATISGGAISIYPGWMIVQVEGESGVADDLDNINGGVPGQILILYKGGENITVRRNSVSGGNIYSDNAYTMNDTYDAYILVNLGTALANKWAHLSFGNNT